MGIDVSFSPFTPSFMHRFLISSSDLRIDARGEWFRLQRLSRQRGSRPILIFVATKKNGSACSGYRDDDLPCPNLIIVAAKKNGPPAVAIAQRGPRPILIFFAATENGFACRGRRGNELPRPILIFVAAEKNGSACSGCRDNDLPRPILFFVAAKKNGSACSSSTKTAKIEVEIGQLLQ